VERNEGKSSSVGITGVLIKIRIVVSLIQAPRFSDVLTCSAR
jgi:hypothetical protein